MSAPVPDVLRNLRHFLAIHEVEPQQLAALIDFSIQRKREFNAGELKPVLAGKTLAMVFQKPSLRTRLGFETAMAQLGGHAINLEDTGGTLTEREDIRDIARVISSMCNGIMARVHTHQMVVELAAYSRVPVINGLSDWAHPCQALADLTTMKEHYGDLAGRKVAYIGDGNNVARSLMQACVKLGIHFAIASPEGYGLDHGVLETAGAWADKSGVKLDMCVEPARAAENADVLYTDVWCSMGQEKERAEREKVFRNYQINSALLKVAKPDARVMHCLPAHRNQEIADDLVDHPQSLIYPQAENRLHTQRALLELLLSGSKPSAA